MSTTYCKLYKCNNPNSTNLLTSELQGGVIHIKAGILKVQWLSCADRGQCIITVYKRHIQLVCQTSLSIEPLHCGALQRFVVNKVFTDLSRKQVLNLRFSHPVCPHTDIILMENSLTFTFLFAFMSLMPDSSLADGFPPDELLCCPPYCHTKPDPTAEIWTRPELVVS